MTENAEILWNDFEYRHLVGTMSCILLVCNHPHMLCKCLVFPIIKCQFMFLLYGPASCNLEDFSCILSLAIHDSCIFHLHLAEYFYLIYCLRVHFYCHAFSMVELITSFIYFVGHAWYSLSHLSHREGKY